MSKRQLKRILKEAMAAEMPLGNAELADIILTMWDEGHSFDEAIDMAFDGQGMPLPDMQTMKRILQIVERQWGSRVTELSVGPAIDDYLTFYEEY